MEGEEVKLVLLSREPEAWALVILWSVFLWADKTLLEELGNRVHPPSCPKKALPWSPRPNKLDREKAPPSSQVLLRLLRAGRDPGAEQHCVTPSPCRH